MSLLFFTYLLNNYTMTEIQKCELAKSKGFTYNHLTGDIRGMKGNIIKKKLADGYIFCCIYLDKKQYGLLAHRLAWYLHYGELPTNHLDHVDGSPSNNKIENLRDVTHQQNHFNRTTAKGYHWNKQCKKFQAYIALNSKLIHLGMFDAEKEARNAYLEAKSKLHVIN